MKKQSTSKSFAILGTAGILVKLLALIYLPFQTAILGNSGNGIVADGYIVFTFLFSLSNAGLPNAISKLVSEQTAHGNFKAAMKILKCAYLVLLGMGVVVALFMAIGANDIANWMNAPDASLMLLALSPTLIFTSVSCALRGYLQGRQNMMPVAISNVLEQILNSVLTVVFAWLLIRYGTKFGAAGTTIGTLVGALGAAAFLCYVFFGLMGKQLKREISNTSPELTQPTTSEVYRQILKYSLPAILNTVATCAASLIDGFDCTRRLQVAKFSLADATSLFGIYQTQYGRLFIVSMAFSTALVTSMIPAISEAIALKNHKLVKHRISESYKAIYLVTIPSIAGISFLALPILTLIFAHHNQGSDLLALGTWTAILMTIQYVQSAVLIAAGNPAAPSVNLIIGMIIKIPINFVLIAIPLINIKGAIIGTAVGWIVAIVLNQLAINKIFNFKIYFIRMMIKPAFAACIMGGVCLLFYKITYSLMNTLFVSSGLTEKLQMISKFKDLALIVSNDITVILAVILGAVIYFGIMIMIGGVTKKDIVRLPMGTRIFRFASKVPMLRAKLET